MCGQNYGVFGDYTVLTTTDAQVALELSSTPVAASTPRALFPDQLTRQLLEG